jgi:DNA-binding IclR family transcriptional regulator
MSAPEHHRNMVKQILAGPRGKTTLAIWNIALAYAKPGTGEIKASREQIAEDVGTHPTEVSRAMNRLAEIGALVRIKPGQFAMNPHINWIGSLDDRKTVALKVPEPA